MPTSLLTKTFTSGMATAPVNSSTLAVFNTAKKVTWDPSTAFSGVISVPSTKICMLITEGRE